MSKHTPLPWHVVPDYSNGSYTLYDENDNYPAQMSESVMNANAEHIVACVNACKGIENPADLRRERDELKAALQTIVDLDDGDSPDLWHFEKEFNAARALLARCQ